MLGASTPEHGETLLALGRVARADVDHVLAARLIEVEVGVVEAKAKGAKTLSIVNVLNSSIVRESDFTLYTRAGAEIAVASTKAFTSQIIGLFLIALRFSQHSGNIAGGVLEEIAQALQNLPAQIQSILDNQSSVVSISKEFARRKNGEEFVYNDCFFLGRGLDHAIAREGALKLKEISYIHADAYAAGELKHGNIALITQQTPVVALLTQDRVREKMISNIKEVVARSAPVIAVIYEDDTETESMVGEAKDFLSNIIMLISLLFQNRELRPQLQQAPRRVQQAPQAPRQRVQRLKS